MTAIESKLPNQLSGCSENSAFRLFGTPCIIVPCVLHHGCINIVFPGQIRKFDNRINFHFIQIRQILSCRENYH